jgi:hypothetical protein
MAGYFLTKRSGTQNERNSRVLSVRVTIKRTRTRKTKKELTQMSQPFLFFIQLYVRFEVYQRPSQ